MSEIDNVENKGKKIAVTGKGGSGKTAMAAIMTKLLVERKEDRILAIDADSAIGLSCALGIEADQTVEDYRRKVIEDPGTKAKLKDRHIRDVIGGFLKPGNGFHLLVMGRPEGPGCYCSVNELLRYGIDSLSKRFDITLIDCEAGPEQINRRVVEGVDVLIAVTDASVRGNRAARTILEVVQKDPAMDSARTGVIINKARGDVTASAESFNRDCGFEVLGIVPEDENIRAYDMAGLPLMDLPDTTPSVVAVKKMLEKVMI